MSELMGREMELARTPTDTLNTPSTPAKLQPGIDPLSQRLIAVRDERCEASFERLYDFYAPRVFTFLRQKGVDARICQEIMQEVMTRVWLKAGLFDERKASASAWIFTIARNRFIDVVRKAARSEIDLNDPLLVRDQIPAPDSRVDLAERNAELRAAIKTLPTEQSDVLRLVYLRGMQQQAVAEQLSIPLNTVKSRLRLALEKMRRYMEHA